MPVTTETLILTLGALTALSAGFNALYFGGYPAAERGRRIASRVLALVNVSFLLQGLYWIATAAGGYEFGPPPWLGVVTLLSSLAITALAIRRLLNGGPR